MAVPVEDLFQSRDAVIPELRGKRQAFDLAGCEAAYRNPLGPQRDLLVVKQDGFAVAGLAQVELDRVGPEALGPVQAVERVLPRPARRAAVADDPDRVGVLRVADGNAEPRG